MKISEMIAALEKAKAEFGDRDMVQFACFGRYPDPVIQSIDFIDGNHIGYPGKAVFITDISGRVTEVGMDDSPTAIMTAPQTDAF